MGLQMVNLFYILVVWKKTSDCVLLGIVNEC